MKVRNTSNEWLQEKENLEKLILVDKISYEQIGKLYNCSGANIKKTALKLGINLQPRRTKNPKETFGKGILKVPLAICLNCGKEFKHFSIYSGKYCSLKCKNEYIHQKGYEKIVKGDSSIMRANYSPKKFKNEIIKEQGGVCAICKILPEWNNKPLVFIIDHIDGNAANNKRDNLRCICPNCDSQLDTYKSRNKNGTRHYYRYHKIKKSE